jgi:protein-disulfide isomerase
MKTGHIRAFSRLRFSTDSAASLNAISVSQATAPESGEQSAPHALVFVTEDGEGERLRIVERFETEGDAEQAAKTIRCVVRRQAFWRRSRSMVRAFGWYVAFPLMVLSLYGPIVTALNGKGSPELSAAILSEVTRVANSQAAPQAPAQQTPLLPTRLSQQMVIEGTAPVRLLPDSPEAQKQDPLVVFSDPKCPACHAVEPALEALSKDRPVFIVPLAYKPGSDVVASAILCSKDQAETAAAWRGMMENGQLPPHDSCERGSAAVKSNMGVAEMIGVSKTPTLMAPDGRLMEGGGTVDQIKTFIGSGGK